MELFLTNGKIKTSNVLEINTKSQDSPEEIDSNFQLSILIGLHKPIVSSLGDIEGVEKFALIQRDRPLSN